MTANLPCAADQLQQRLNRELRAISSCNQALMRAEDERALLDEISRIICEIAGYRAAFVAFAEQDADKTVRLAAWAGVDEGYFRDVQLTWADQGLGRGPLGTAIRTGAVVQVQEIATDTRMTSWREKAEARGYRSAIALPLRDEHQTVFGALLIYGGEANALIPEEVRLLEELAADLAFGITHLRARDERRQAETQLVASEQLFRAMVENSPDFIARYDRELRRVYVNPSLRRLFSAGSPAMGKTPATASPLKDPAKYMACLRLVVQTAHEQSGEFEFEDVDGTSHWAHMRFAPEFDGEGQVATVLAISRDITDRKRDEDRLRLAASVFATSQEGILISDTDNRIIDINPAFTRLTGYTRDEVLGRNPSFLSAGRQSPAFYEAMWRAIGTQGAWQGELWNRRKSGEVYAEYLSVVAVKDDQGRLQHYVGAFSDISVIKAHEADLDRIAHYDVLTGVPNRRLLSDRLDQAIAVKGVEQREARQRLGLVRLQRADEVPLELAAHQRLHLRQRLLDVVLAKGPLAERR